MESDKERIARLEKAYHDLWNEHELLKNRIKEEYAKFKAFKTSKFPELSEDKPVKANPATQNPTISEVKPSINWEAFIGEKLLSKIGILIVLIGVALGAKYAISNNLIGETSRITLGYFVAIALGLTAYYFRIKMRGFSAVLASGAIAAAYFMTYASYSFYQVLPLPFTFILLLLIVALAILLAWYYDQVIIAHLALVGAYILPPLVSTGDKHIIYYFGYMFLIDLAMLFISWRRKWITIPYPIMVWTSGIFLYWFMTTYNPEVDTLLAGLALFGFFLVFVAAIIGRNLMYNESLTGSKISQLALVSVSYFGSLGFVYGNTFKWDKALFILAGASIFFIIKFLARKNQPEQMQRMFGVFGIFGLLTILTFVTGSYSYLYVLFLGVFLLQWLAPVIHGKLEEAIGAITAILGMVLFLIAFIYEMPWYSQYKEPQVSLPLTAGLIAIVAGIVYFQLMKYQENAYDTGRWKLAGALVLVACFFGANDWVETLYSFKLAPETIDYYEILREKMQLKPYAGAALMIGIMLLILAYNNLVVSGNKPSVHLQIYAFIICFISLILFSGNTYQLTWIYSGEQWTKFNLMKYISFIGVLSVSYYFINTKMAQNWTKMLAVVFIVWVFSQELVQWSVVYNYGVGYKLLLSLLWTFAAVIMIVVGIRNKDAILRITAMSLLGITLLKLFTFDLNSFSTLSKTIVFVCIGGLLLVGAYFYQKEAKKNDTKVSEPNTDTGNEF